VPATESLWLEAANTFVLFLTLIVVAWYAWETQRLRKTAQDQLEALHYPFVVPDYDDQPANVQQTFLADIMEVLQIKGYPQDLVGLRNLGTGPALKVECFFKPKNGGNRATLKGKVAFVPVSGAVPISADYQTLKDYEYDFTFEYFSVSGQKYQTKGTVEKGILKNVSIQPLR
jgi:hypothetical protein